MFYKGGIKMRMLIAIILALLLATLITSLPLYLICNFVFWVLHLTFRITIFQAFGLTLAAIAIREIFFSKEGK